MVTLATFKELVGGLLYLDLTKVRKSRVTTFLSKQEIIYVVSMKY